MLVKTGDTDPISRVRLVEPGNTGEICRGEGGGDGNGNTTGCKGAMYRRLSVLNTGMVATVVSVLFPWQRDDVIFLVNSAAHCTYFALYSAGSTAVKKEIFHESPVKF